MAKSLLNSKLKKNFNICAVNSSNEIKFLNFKKTKVMPVFNVVFLLVKPNIFYKEGKSFSKYLNTQTKVISCMAGVKKSTISKKLNTKKIVRIMPNILSLFGGSHTCVFSNDKNLANWTMKNITNIFGTSFIVKNENDIHKATALFGSGPAFIAKIISSYLKASKKMNFKYANNEEPILMLFRNVIELSKIYGGLDKFIKTISSKKGTTQEGINFLEKVNIEKIIYTTIFRSYKRSKELSIEK